MNTLSEIIIRTFVPELYSHHEPKIEEIVSPLSRLKSPRHLDYECEVFNFLLENKDQLGIRHVFRFHNLEFDGGIQLVDEKMIAVEIKLRMNWMKACQSGWQFTQFLQKNQMQSDPFLVTGAIVYFEEFSADWSRQAKSRVIENGWNHWYIGHSKVDNYRIDLVRIRQGKLEGFPLQTGG